jgi:hypothetical protein
LDVGYVIIVEMDGIVRRLERRNRADPEGRPGHGARRTIVTGRNKLALRVDEPSALRLERKVERGFAFRHSSQVAASPSSR